MLQLLDFNENPNVGVYCRANDSVIFLQRQMSKKIKKLITDALDVKIVELNIADANIIGSLLVINSTGAILTDFADDRTIRAIDLNQTEHWKEYSRLLAKVGIWSMHILAKL